MSFEHEPWCQRKGFHHEDAAKRIADTYSLHRIAGDALGHSNMGRWFAASIQDGTTDNVLYDSKSDAVRHQHHNENRYTYIKIGPFAMTACSAAVMLKTARWAYESGLRMADPDDRKTGGVELIKRASIEDMRNLAFGRVSNIRF